ncbi:endonuclease/exonuclease/phosphatase family protein [Mucisphaera calidilacus]|uniref:Endonuclease/Exonuclease/phosphatase family protein n=1 Tax=Mucisphaera calidilacus TaxID=2527982 RepID=A0A518BTA7_9BACT|nr:endonuclease/exonuclease/phosphatase family protein [Mucisphaera calidilacus]QDU70213.1 Endonuclease/Exonuclease/phosphatase family protein [Mucisphaera calidilacus]
MLQSGLLCLLVMGVCTASAWGEAPGPEPDFPALREAEVDGRFTAMTFNIRFGTAKDGEHAWPHRRAAVIGMIRRHDPDVLGVQEALAFQVDELQAALPAYWFWGVGRDDGERGGEFCGLFLRADRFVSVDRGHLWLSETPEVVASVGWDASMTRMLSWVLVEDRVAGQQLVVANTHFDHRGPVSRLEAARLIRNRMAMVPDAIPLVLLGDFNAGEGSPPYRALVHDEHAVVAPLVDAYRLANPERRAEEGTYNRFRADEPRTGDRIDWILHTGGLVTRESLIDYGLVDGVLASDHDPVIAVLAYTPASE